MKGAKLETLAHGIHAVIVNGRTVAYVRPYEHSWVIHPVMPGGSVDWERVIAVIDSLNLKRVVSALEDKGITK